MLFRVLKNALRRDLRGMQSPANLTEVVNKWNPLAADNGLWPEGSSD